MQISKSAIKRWQEHCAKVQNATLVNSLEDEADKIIRIEKAKADYNFFVHYYFPHYAKNPCAQFQIDAANAVLNNNQIRAVFEWARMHSKSVTANILLPMWLMLHNQLNVMILVGKSEDNAKTLLSDLQAELQFNQRYINDYGEQFNMGSWEEGRFITKNGKAFFALGRGQSPRGLRYKQNRPDYIVSDDIDDDELVTNDSRVNKMVDWVLEALFNTMDMGSGRFILVGNRISKTSVLAHIAQVPGIYHSRVNALNDTGQPSWSEKYSVADINNVIQTIGTRRAQKEFFNNPLTDGSIFKSADIRFKQLEPFSNYNYVVTYTDPSFKSGPKNDYKATITVAKTNKGEYHIIKAFVEQTTVQSMVQWHYTINSTYGRNIPIHYYMESNFIQDLLLEEFKVEGIIRADHIPIVPDKRAKPDKHQRIQNLQPLFERGLIFFNQSEKNDTGMKRLIEQLLLFEKGAKFHDDGPDALEGAIYKINERTRIDQPMLIGRRGVGTYVNTMRF